MSQQHWLMAEVSENGSQSVNMTLDELKTAAQNANTTESLACVPDVDTALGLSPDDSKIPGMVTSLGTAWTDKQSDDWGRVKSALDGVISA